MVRPARHLLQTILGVTRDLVSLALSAMRSRAQLAAENLFLRKQLALYQERKVKPRRAHDGTRIILAGLSHFLAAITGHCHAGDTDPLASKGIPAVLALEVTCARSAAYSCGRAAADRDDGGVKL